MCNGNGHAKKLRSEYSQNISEHCKIFQDSTCVPKNGWGHGRYPAPHACRLPSWAGQRAIAVDSAIGGCGEQATCSCSWENHDSLMLHVTFFHFSWCCLERFIQLLSVFVCMSEFLLVLQEM